MYRIALAAFLMCASTSALADTKATATAGLDVNASFAEQRSLIEKQLADGTTYSEISSSDRSKVREALGRIASNLDGSSMNALNEEKKALVFNDQEQINTILTQAGDDSRLVCTRGHKVGSHRPATTCLTVAERRRLREQSKEALRGQPMHLKPGS